MRFLNAQKPLKEIIHFADIYCIFLFYLKNMLRLLFTSFLICLVFGFSNAQKLSGTIIGTQNTFNYTTNECSTTVNTAANAFDGNLTSFFCRMRKKQRMGRTGFWRTSHCLIFILALFLPFSCRLSIKIVALQVQNIKQFNNIIFSRKWNIILQKLRKNGRHIG